MAIRRPSYQEFFDYDIDVPSRTLFLGPNTDDKCTENLIKGIHILQGSTGDIQILLDNWGGDVYQGYGIYDAIKACKNHVKAITFGPCMSMGLFVLQAADRRIAGANTRFMAHYGYNESNGHVKDAERVGDECKFTNKRMEEVLFSRIRKKKKKYTMEEMRKFLTFDTYFSAKEAVDMGLCDEVL